MAVTINSVIPKTGVGRVLAVARAVSSRPKGMTRDAISAKLNLKAGTGSANNRVIAAKKFGVIQTGRTGGYVLTDLGRRLAAPDPSREDIVAAIRHVAPFARFIDAVEGDLKEMPEADIRAGLEAAGVRPAELDIATRVFIASWNYHLPDTPAADGNSDDVEQAPVEAADDEAGAAAAGPIPNDTAPPPGAHTRLVDHQMVRWVLEQAPPVGEPWPAERYQPWSELLRSTIRFLYPDTAGTSA